MSVRGGIYPRISKNNDAHLPVERIVALSSLSLYENYGIPARASVVSTPSIKIRRRLGSVRHAVDPDAQLHGALAPVIRARLEEPQSWGFSWLWQLSSDAWVPLFA